MARKRMFDLEIINQDSFLDLPMESKAIYFLLGMEADDEGFVAPRKVLRLYGGTEDSLKILIAKNFIIPFNTGVIVITDWKRNNWLDSRRIKNTIYQEEKAQITYNPTSEKYEISNSLIDAKRMLSENSIEENRTEENRVNKNKDEEYYSNKDLNDLFLDFLKLRKKLKAVNSERAINSLIKTLSEYDDETKYKMIENSITNSWKGIFPLKENKAYKPVREEIVPNWMNKETNVQAATKEEQKEMEDLLREFDNP